jgi:molybdate transport system substrate-binding protein
MKRVVLLWLLPALVLSACSATVPSPTSPRETLVVFAASSLTGAFGEIGHGFEGQHAGVTVTLNFAGSQALRTQIEQGAPADVFASAGPADMDTLVADGFVAKSDVQALLTNQLEVIMPAANPAALAKLEDLAQPGIKLVLAASDVPVGKYTQQALDLMDAAYGNDFKSHVLANVVSNEDNVKQVLAKVQLGEADAGIVYISDAVSAPELKTIKIPEQLNVIAHYVIASPKGTPHAALAAQFIDYVVSDAGQQILVKWGFGPR